MAEEPRPNASEVPASAPPVGAKAAESAALSNLADEPSTSSDTGPAPKAADTAALGQALDRLSLQAGEGSAAAAKKEASAKAKEKEGEDVKKKIKVDPADVSFLVEELELGKIKATDLLRSCGGNREEAVKKFVLPKMPKN